LTGSLDLSVIGTSLIIPKTCGSNIHFD
jgi:hypothetical protein